MRVRSILAAALAFVAACGAPQIQVDATYGQMSASGDAKMTTSGGGATASSSLDELGLDSEEAALGLRGDFKWGLPHLTVATTSMSWSGNGTLSADFGDISADADVESDLDLRLTNALLTFDLLPTDTFELGLGLGVAVVDFNGQVKDTGSAASEQLDEVVPVPVLAARLGLRLWVFDCEALASGVSATVDGNDMTYLDADLNLKYAFFGEPGSMSGSFILGWRRVDLAANYDDSGDEVDLDLSFTGPYLGLQLGL